VIKDEFYKEDFMKEINNVPDKIRGLRAKCNFYEEAADEEFIVNVNGKDVNIGFTERDGDIKFVSKREFYKLINKFEGDLSDYKQQDPMTSETLARIEELEDFLYGIKKL
jgi:hypothetical protein